jgi:ABC-2 type transport system permease protein
MTTDTLDAPPIPVLPHYRDPQRVTLPRVLRSEWTKLRTLRSSSWSLLSAAFIVVAVGILLCMAQATQLTPTQIATLDSTATSLNGVYLAQVAIGSLGVLAITGEYATGMIKLTLTAVPRRLPVLWAKAVALAALIFVVCAPAVLATFLVGQHVLAAHHAGVTLGHPGTARALLGAVLLLACVGLLGLGLGGLLRNTAAALASLFGLLFGISILVSFLPSNWSEHVAKFLPYSAGTAILNTTPDPGSLAPWTGLGVFSLYVVAALALGAWRLRTRDA